MKVLFRADSSSTIGLGHIMRDLVLAKQFSDKGDEVIFACQELEGNINHKISKAGYKLEILKSHDIEALDQLIKKLQIDMIVIDHYGIDYKFEKELKTKNPKLKIFSFDDTYKRHYCDILLNHNIYADKRRYKDLVPKHCELRCGEKYTLIREEFQTEKGISREKRYDLLVAMGGADTKNLSLKIVKLIPKSFRIAVVTTGANKHLDELKEYAKDKDNIKLHINSNEIAKLINESRFCVITPSTITHEVLYLNIPFLAIKTANNQELMVRYLMKHRYKVIDDFEEKKFLKVAIELKNFIDLSDDEKERVLSWRNHPEIRKWMFDKDEISLKSHLEYIKSLQQREDKRYFMVNYLGENIGVIDFTNIDKDKADIGLYAKPDIYGVGSVLMQAIIEYGFKELKLKKLVAQVYEDNTKAINLYKKFYFVEIERGNAIITMERQR